MLDITQLSVTLLLHIILLRECFVWYQKDNKAIVISCKYDRLKRLGLWRP